MLIGIALACRPELVIADEPTSALDVTVQRRILDHLEERIAETGASVLLITHDLGVAADRADRIVVMKDGRIVETGSALQVLDNPQHAVHASLIAAAPNSRGCASSRRPGPRWSIRSCPSPACRRPSASARTSSLDGGAGRVVRCAPRPDAVAGGGIRIGQVDDGADRDPARDRNDRNGQASNGRDITALRGRELRALRRRVQIVHQNPYASLDPKLRIREIVAEPLDAFGIGTRAERRARVAELARPGGAGAVPTSSASRPSCRAANVSASQLRERSRCSRNCVVLDEPVSALDVSVQAQILDSARPSCRTSWA